MGWSCCSCMCTSRENIHLTLRSFLILALFLFGCGRQEAAGALWNLSFDDRNREAIAAVGGVEALVSFYG